MNNVLNNDLQALSFYLLICLRLLLVIIYHNVAIHLFLNGVNFIRGHAQSNMSAFYTERIHIVDF